MSQLTDTATGEPAVGGSSAVPVRQRGSAAHRRPDGDPALVVARRRLLAAWSGRRRNRSLLAVVAGLFGLLQLSVMGLHYGYGWDEAVYLSMINPTVPDANWAPWRAWGVPLLAAPAAGLDAPNELIRLYQMLLSSTMVYVSFRTWLAVRNTIAVPVAAFVFSTLFITIYYGPYAMPNFYVAVFSVMAAGFLLRVVGRLGRWPLLGLAFAVFAVALIRPSDSVWLVIALAVAWVGLVVRRGMAWWRTVKRSLAVFASVAAAEVLGWTPWVIEAFARFNGPAQRWEEARAAVGGGLHLDLKTVELYVRMSSGRRIMCYCAEKPYEAGLANTAVLAWWVAAGVLALVGVVAAWRSVYRRFVFTAFTTGVGMAFSYLFILDYAASRFLLPGLALMSLPVAFGLLAIYRLVAPAAPRWRRLAVFGLAALLVTHLGLQLNVLRIRMPVDRATHAAPRQLADGIRAAGIAPPCLLVGAPTPMLINYLPCQWNVEGRSAYLRTEPPAVRAARDAGRPVGIISRVALPADSYLRSWRRIGLNAPGEPGWSLYLPPSH